MSKRKAFLATLSAGGAALVVGPRARAATPLAATAPPGKPSLAPGSGAEVVPSALPRAEREPAPAVPSASTAASVKPPSAAALALAATFRRFDRALTDAELTRIARGIDDGRAGNDLNPKGSRLRNGDEPATGFSVEA